MSGDPIKQTLEDTLVHHEESEIFEPAPIDTPPINLQDHLDEGFFKSHPQHQQRMLRGSTTQSCSVLVSQSLSDPSRLSVVPTSASRPGTAARKQHGRIMVAVDTSDSSIKAFEWAIEHLVNDGDTVYLFHVVESPPSFTSQEQRDAWMLDIGKRIQRDYTAILKKHLSKDVSNHSTFNLPPRPQSPVSFVSVEGNPKRVHLMTEVKLSRTPRDSIVNAAVRYGSLKALVMGSRGLGSVKSMLLGSMSAYASKHSPVPVVIVRGN